MSLASLHKGCDLTEQTRRLFFLTASKQDDTETPREHCKGPQVRIDSLYVNAVSPNWKCDGLRLCVFVANSRLVRIQVIVCGENLSPW
ncbi:hypothetical protein BaRGS_00015305 [Batillaria attramentaria]|uniref:Uncharacterized protein n=1 Tax=Batillaria attramentaria TaxID=370345 RepID=A0ABD0L2P7_9CAEN